MFIYLLNDNSQKGFEDETNWAISDSGWWDEIESVKTSEKSVGFVRLLISVKETNKELFNKIFDWNIIRKQILPG